MSDQVLAPDANYLTMATGCCDRRPQQQDPHEGPAQVDVGEEDHQALVHAGGQHQEVPLLPVHRRRRRGDRGASRGAAEEERVEGETPKVPDQETAGSSGLTLIRCEHSFGHFPAAVVSFLFYLAQKKRFRDGPFGLPQISLAGQFAGLCVVDSLVE